MVEVGAFAAERNGVIAIEFWGSVDPCCGQAADEGAWHGDHAGIEVGGGGVAGEDWRRLCFRREQPEISVSALPHAAIVVVAAGWHHAERGWPGGGAAHREDVAIEEDAKARASGEGKGHEFVADRVVRVEGIADGADMDIEVFERLGGFDAEVAGVARMGRDQLDLWLEVGPDRGGQAGRLLLRLDHAGRRRQCAWFGVGPEVWRRSNGKVRRVGGAGCSFVMLGDRFVA